MAFEAVLEQLKNELYKEGFEIGGITDFQQPLNGHTGVTTAKYKVLAVYNPFLFKEMLMLSPFQGLILPCYVSIMELYPGETAVVPYNVTAQTIRGIQNPSLENLAAEVTRRLELAIHALEREQSTNPDLITSWS